MTQQLNTLSVRNLVVRSVGDLYVDNIECENDIQTSTLNANNVTSDILITGKSIACESLDVSNALLATTIESKTSIRARTYLDLPTASTVTKGIVQLDNSYTSTSTITAPTSNALKLVQDNVNIVSASANRWKTTPGTANMTYVEGNIGIGTTLASSTLHVLGEITVQRGNFLLRDGRMCIGTDPNVVTGYKIQVCGDVYIDGNIYVTGNVYQV